MPDISALNKRFDELRSVEISKDNFIEELLNQVKALDVEIREKNNEISDQRRLVASYRDENNKYQADLLKIRYDQDKLSFVSILVDGDGMNFLPNLVQNGKSGGHEAARNLIQAVDEHIRKVDPKAPAHVSIRIRIYANVEGLTKAYRAANILPDDKNLTPFIQGFNRADELCDFVDVGDGKEGSDVKLKALFKQDMLDVHCRRVLFCGSADNGYAHLIRPYQRSTRLSLIEGPPFASELRELATEFETASFKDLFMSTKLIAQEKRAITPPKAVPNGNYAAAAKTVNPLPTPTATPTPTLFRSTASSINPKLSLCLNAQGERVDRTLATSSKEKMALLKRRKLCNMYHLVGACDNEICSHTHGPTLSPQELVDLTFIARSSPCYDGLACRQVTCFNGHCCIFNNNCGQYRSNNCRFDGTMHSVDTKVYEVLDEFAIHC